MWPRTLRGLGLAFLAAFLGVVIVVGLSIYVATHDALDREVDRRLAAVAAEIVPDPEQPPLAKIVGRIALLERQRETRDIGFMLLDRAGRPVAGTIRTVLPPRGFSGVDRASGIPGLSRGRALVIPAGDGFTLALIAESEPIDHFDSSFVRVLLLGLASIAAMVVVGMTALTGTIGRRMTDLRTVATAIIDGDMTGRVRLDGSGSDFDQTAALFNRMLDRIRQLMEGIRHVANDAAHDLRTPLARLRGRLAAIARAAAGGALQADVEKALQEADDALALCAAILRIAEIDSARRHFAHVDLVLLIEDLAAAYLPTVEEQRRPLEIVTDGPATVFADRTLLIQLFANLIENWLVHTDAGTAMKIRITRQHDGVSIVLADRGPGIPEDKIEAAMHRFTRLGSGPGHGIGLPLVAAIVRMHRGELQLADAGPGLAVTIRIPACPETAG